MCLGGGGSRWRNMGFSPVCFVFGPLWASSPPLSGPFDATEVIVDYSLLSASIFVRASRGTRGGEAKAATYFYTNFPL